LRTIDKKLKDFSNKYIERSEVKSKVDNSVYQPKEQFLFGEKDQMLFSDGDEPVSM
jgi:hypothetical protein